MNKTQPLKEQFPSIGSAPNKALSQNYGGIHVRRWVDLLPSSWIPYIQLARIDPPAALCLIYFPHLFGILHAANRNRLSINAVLKLSALLLAGSFFFSNAAHAWNDLIDAPIDRQISRTKNRPIVRGAISPRGAFVFTATQAVWAAAFLLLFPLATAISTIPTIVGTIYYPWAKRHTNFPQVVLGFCLAWETVVGSAATGVEEPWKDPSILLLVLSFTLWTVIYDTIYAYQDIADDTKIGVKSTAVLFRENTKSFLWFLLFLMGTSLTSYGHLTEAGIGYYIIVVGGSISSLSLMISNVELRNEASCWWWFSNGFWATGLSIAVGLMVEYGLDISSL